MTLLIEEELSWHLNRLKQGERENRFFYYLIIKYSFNGNILSTFQAMQRPSWVFCKCLDDF